MSRLDYSKWDNIQTDSSEDEAPAPRAPQANSPAGPQAAAPTAAAPAPGPAAPLIPCTYGPSAGDPRALFFTPEALPANHAAFTAGTPSPVAYLVGLPLLVHRLDPRPSLTIPHTAAMDNQRVTYLMIDPASGFAPPEWQAGVGSVLLVRRDRQPLPPAHVEAFWMFCCSLIDQFGSGDDPDPDVAMTPRAWRKFYTRYRQEYLQEPARRAEWLAVRQAPWELMARGPEVD